MSKFTRKSPHPLLASSTSIETSAASDAQSDIPGMGTVTFFGPFWTQTRSNGEIDFIVKAPKDSSPKELMESLLSKIDDLVKSALSIIPDDVVCPEEFDPDALVLDEVIFFGERGLKLFFMSDYSKRHLDYLRVVFNSVDSFDVVDRCWIS